MPKPVRWKPDDKPGKWQCPECGEVIPDDPHDIECQFGNHRDPTRAQIDEAAFQLWTENLKYDAIQRRKRIKYLAEVYDLPYETAAICLFLDVTSLSITGSLTSMWNNQNACAGAFFRLLEPHFKTDG